PAVDARGHHRTPEAALGFRRPPPQQSQASGGVGAPPDGGLSFSALRHGVLNLSSPGAAAAKTGARHGRAPAPASEAADVADRPDVGLAAVVGVVAARPVGAQAVGAIEDAGAGAIVEAFAVAEHAHVGSRGFDAGRAIAGPGEDLDMLTEW